MGISTASFAKVTHPHDALYRQKRQEYVDELLLLSERKLGQMLSNLANMPAIKDEDKVSQQIIGELYNQPGLPQQVKGILDSTSGTTGNVLIRQDLEPIIYA